MVYIGIDPGKSGGIACLTAEGFVLLAAKMPETPGALHTLLSQIPLNRGVTDFDRCVILEQVWGSPTMRGPSGFKFGKNVGHIEMVLTVARMPYQEVPPIVWQKAMGCLSPKGLKLKFGSKDKGINLRLAEKLWPRFKITHAIADALLLAEYGRRVSLGTIPARRIRHGQKGE